MLLMKRFWICQDSIHGFQASKKRAFSCASHRFHFLDTEVSLRQPVYIDLIVDKHSAGVRLTSHA